MSTISSNLDVLTPEGYRKLLSTNLLGVVWLMKRSQNGENMKKMSLIDGRPVPADGHMRVR